MCFARDGITKFIKEKSFCPSSPVICGAMSVFAYVDGAFSFIMFKKFAPAPIRSIFSDIYFSSASWSVIVTVSFGIKSFEYIVRNLSNTSTDFFEFIAVEFAHPYLFNIFSIVSFSVIFGKKIYAPVFFLTCGAKFFISS